MAYELEQDYIFLYLSLGIGEQWNRKLALSADERLTSQHTRTLPESFSLCDSDRIRVPRFNGMDDLTSRCAAIGTELQ
jgi:hypothetical protein